MYVFAGRKVIYEISVLLSPLQCLPQIDSKSPDQLSQAQPKARIHHILN
jgi:hypothetical protein